MKTVLRTTLVLSLLAATTAGAQTLLPVESSDLAATSLVAAPQTKGLTVTRDAVATSWKIDAAKLAAHPEPFLSRSREYFVEVTARDLQQGVALHTTAPAALVRINPATLREGEIAEKIAIAPSSLVLTAPSGLSLAAGSGMDKMAGPRELEAAAAPFAEGTSAFRLREDLGAGVFELRAETLAVDAARRYVIHVFERQSPIELILRTAEIDYLHGQTLKVEAALFNGKRKLRARRVEGFVTSPAGRVWPLTFSYAGDGIYSAGHQLDALEEAAPGLWQVEIFARAMQPGAMILRSGQTAFGCAVPSARLSGGTAIESASQGLQVSLDVETATAGRYEARGVLWATNSNGDLQPVGVAHSADWLRAGSGEIALAFASDLLEGVTAPFEIRDLRLIDQGRMGLLHRQARALVVTQ